MALVQGPDPCTGSYLQMALVQGPDPCRGSYLQMALVHGPDPCTGSYLQMALVQGPDPCSGPLPLFGVLFVGNGPGPFSIKHEVGSKQAKFACKSPGALIVVRALAMKAKAFGLKLCTAFSGDSEVCM